MSALRQWPLLALAVPVTALLPAVRALAQASMLGHMLAIAATVAAGMVLSMRVPITFKAYPKQWDEVGIAGLIVAAALLMTWMVPYALDRATEDAAVDAFKTISLFMAGIILALAFQRAALATQLFFVWNWVLMTVFVGLLYQSVPQRLCSAYLLGDQSRTGTFLMIFAAAVGLGWCASAWHRLQSDTNSSETAATERK